MKNDEFEVSLSHLEVILSVFAEELANKQRFGSDVEDSSIKVAATLHNIGIVHMLSKNYDAAVQIFQKALEIREKYQESILNIELDVSANNNSIFFAFLTRCASANRLFLILIQATLSFIGLAYYAVEDFRSAKKCLKKALASVQDYTVGNYAFVAEILNNLGCAHYETGNHTKAIKLFEESLSLQRYVVATKYYRNKSTPSKKMLMKIAFTRANIGYVHFELKNNDAALDAFEKCRKVI